MYSITFSQCGNVQIQVPKNTWDDWMLAPSSRPVFNPPALKEHIIDIPGKDGVLDLSESLGGFPVYDRREGTMEFYVLNSYGSRTRLQEWYQVYSTIMEFLHGRTCRAVLSEEPDYFYEGRFFVQEWKSEKDYSKIIIGYKVDPYKWEIQTSSQKDPSRYIKTVPINGHESMYPYGLHVGQGTTHPTFTISGNSGDLVDLYYFPSYAPSPGESAKVVALETGHTYEIQDATIKKGLQTPVYSLMTDRYVSGPGHVNTGPVTVQMDFRKGIL